MADENRAIDQIIQQAIREGQFDNLPGKGKPLKLDENPFEDQEWKLAFKVLKDNQFTLPWIADRREIEEEIEAARAALLRTWGWRQESIRKPGEAGRVEQEWQKAEKDFRRKIQTLNKRIRDYNLQAPRAAFQKTFLDVEAEIRKVTG
jgi:DnaJ family protein C protein 28